MRKTVVIPIEGVLRKPFGGQINEDGYYLFRALSAWYPVILITQEIDKGRTVDWLDKEGIFKYDDIIYGDFPQNATDRYWTNVIQYVRARGYVLGMCVVVNPSEARDVVDNHVPVLMYSQPAYGLPEWLPGSKRGAESWDSLVAKVETDRAARLEDQRMNEELK